MPDWFPFLLCFILAAIPLVLVTFQKRVLCQVCSTPLPKFILPWNRTIRQYVEPGWTCMSCGSTLNARGEAIDPDAPISKTAIRVTVLTLLIVGLIQLAIFVPLILNIPLFSRRPPALPIAAPPPIVVAPQPAPEP